MSRSPIHHHGTIHAVHPGQLRKAGVLLALLALGLLLAWALPAPHSVSGISGYEPLHTLLETIAVIVAVMVFSVGWHAHSRELPGNFVLLACAFMGVALLDFSHALSFAGMPAYVTPSDPEKAINFWLAARAVAAVALLVAAAAPWRPFAHGSTRYACLAGVLAVTALAHWLFLFHPGSVPRTFMPPQGLTPFKIAAEDLLIALNGLAAVVLGLRMRKPQPFNATALFVAVCTMAMSEVFFTLYASVSDVYNLMGHLYKVLAYLFLYRAIFVETVERPHRLLSEQIAQRRQVESERDRMVAVLESTTDFVGIGDATGQVQYLNHAARELRGVGDRPVAELQIPSFHPEWAAAKVVGEGIPTALRDGAWSGETAWLGADGREIPVSQVIMAHKNAAGDTAFISTIARDVTLARQAQDALRVSEQRLQQATRAANIGIFDHDHMTDTIYWSSEQRQHYGFSPDERVTLAAFLACLHPDDLDRIATAVQRAHDPSGDGLFDVEHRIIRRDGAMRDLTTRSMTMFVGVGEQRHKVRTVGAVLDVTERKAAQQALRLRDEALQNSLNAIAMSDMQGRLTYVNDAFLQLWGLAHADEALGRPAEAFWQDPSQAHKIIERLATGSSNVRDELVGLRRDGSTVDVALWASLAAGPNGEPLGLISSFLDITERKRAEAELQQLNATLEARVQARTSELESALTGLRQAQGELVRTETMASLGSLVAGVAHELNTPIGNAVMVASTLSGRQREFEASMATGLRRSALEGFLNTTREVSDVLERNLQRAAELIGSFKQLAVDQSSYQRREFEVSEVVQEIALALSPTLRRSRVQLIDDTPVGLRMDSYPGPLGQVFVNLVNNAVVHAFEGRPPGTVRIAAERVASDRVRLVIGDNGNGIGREHLKQIFDPFFTTKLGQGGSGMGLHIVYTLVTGLLGGRIDVASQPGQGTEFHIELPLRAPDALVDKPVYA
ncbi:MAG: PAS domain S-box protein [Ideonella sp.]|nr:PAS domain S-box protein [Ideonella sp.]